MKISIIKAIALISLSSTLLAKEPKDPKEEKINKNEMRKANYSLFVSEKRNQFLETEKYIRRLKNKLDRNEIIGLELLVAGPTDARIESKWGHSMLRFVDRVGTLSDDLVLGFVAEVDDVQLNMAKGIFGGYPVFPNVQSLRLFNQQYIKNEDRPIERFIIPSTQKQRNHLIQLVIDGWEDIKRKDFLSMEKSREKAKAKTERKLKEGEVLQVVYSEDDEEIAYFIDREAQDKKDINYVVKYNAQRTKGFGNYTFFTKNCAGALFNLLSKASLLDTNKIGLNGRVPVKMYKSFQKHGIVFFPKEVIPGIYDFKKKIKTLLAIEDDEIFYDYLAWPENAALVLDKELNLKEKLLLLEVYPMIRDDIQKKILKSVPVVNKRPSYDQLFEIKSLNSVLYDLCNSKECVLKQMEEALKIWTQEQINNSLENVKSSKIKPYSDYYELLINGRNL